MIRNAPDYPDLATAVAALVDGDTLYFPADRGPYSTSVTLDFSRLLAFTLQGDGFVPGHHGTGAGSSIQGSVAGDLVRYVNSHQGQSFTIAGLDFRNTNFTYATAAAVHVEGFNGVKFEHCQFAGNRGLWVPGNSFTLTVNNCIFNGSLSNCPNGIGLLCSGQTAVEGCDFTGWAEGVRAFGSQVSLRGCRFEVNKVGLRLGIDANGNSFILSVSAFEGISSEANDCLLQLNSVSCCAFHGVGSYGTSGAPSGLSQFGINLTGNLSDVFFAGIEATGSYSGAGINLGTHAANRVTWLSAYAENKAGGTVWQTVGSQFAARQFLNTNCPLEAP